MARACQIGAFACLVALAGGCGSSGSSPRGTGATLTPTAASSEAAASSPPPASNASGASTAKAPNVIVGLSRLRLPTPTSRAVAFASGSSLILAGGLTAGGTTSVVLRITIPAGEVATVGRLRYPVHDAAAVELGGSLLVLGGGTSTQEAWVQRVGASRQSPVVGRLPAARADLGAAAVGSEAIVVGGGASGRPDPRILATRDGVHFRLVTQLPVAVRYAAVVAVAGTVFVIGGVTPSGDVALIQAVDVRAGTAKVVGRLPMTLSHATALLLDGSIVVAGGRRAGRALDAVLLIDPTTLGVRIAARLPQAMSDAAGAVVQGVGYLVGGETTRPLSTIVTIKAS